MGVKKYFLLASLVASLVAVANSPVASAAPPSDKVVVCHRTHSVKNPYVRITVAQSSVGNGNGKHGGNSHDQYSTVLFPGGKPNPNVFNLSVTYTPAPEKKWGDIISFTDTAGNTLTGTAGNVKGLNNTGIGKQIFDGTGLYAGLCKSRTPRDFYEIEVIEGGQPPADVLADMNEFDADEFASAKTSCGGSFTGCDASKLGSPSADAPTTTVAGVTTTTVAGATATTVPGATATTVAGATATTVAGATATTVAATRKLKGKIWIDANRNGKKDASEKILAEYKVTVTADTGNSSTQTFTVTTDTEGNYEVPNIPAGNWIVRPLALSSANYETVFDSDSNLSSADWVVKASVPATGEATADFATALSAAAIASGATDTLGVIAVKSATAAAAPNAPTSVTTASEALPATGSTDILPVMWFAICLLLIGSLIALRRRTIA
jgi:LPXTG-motif cell wall-anchored protein